jgi:ABC-2 type transport system ATP-binding protein
VRTALRRPLCWRHRRLHPTAAWYLEILAEIAKQFLLVANGGVTRQPNFQSLVDEPRFRSYLGPEITRAAESLCSNRANGT